MTLTKSPRLQITRWSAGSDPVARTDFDSDSEQLEENAAMYAQGTLTARPAAGIEGRFYVVKGDLTTSNNGKLFYDNGTIWSAANKFATDLVVENEVATNPSLTVKGGVSVVTDILQFKDNSNNNLVRLGADKKFYVGSSIFGTTQSGGIAAVVNAVQSGQSAMEVRGFATPGVAAFSVHQGATVSPVFSVDTSGTVVGTGTWSTATLNVSGTLTVPVITAATSATLGTTSVRALNSTQTSLTVGTRDSQVNNAIEFTKTMANTRYARFTSAGDFATDLRVNVGAGFGNATGLLSSTTPQFVVGNSIASNVPTARIIGHGSQTGNIFEVTNGAGANQLHVTASGSTVIANQVTAAAAAIGGATRGTVDGAQPVVEILTGTASGAYNDQVVFRHSNKTGVPATRRVALTMKLGSETGSEADNAGGIALISEAANAEDPILQFHLGGSEVGVFDASGDFRVNNKVIVNDPLIQMRTNLLYMGGGTAWGEWSDIAPRAPINNDVWVDTNTNTLKYAYAANAWATIASADIDVTQVGGSVMATIGNGWSGVSSEFQEGIRKGNLYQVTLLIERTGGTITASSKGNFVDSVNQICSLQGIWKPYKQHNSVGGTINGDETLGCSLRINTNGAVVLQSAAPGLQIKTGDQIEITALFMKPGALTS